MQTQQTAKTQYADVDGIKLAYRRFGNTSTSSPPLVLTIHFRGTMDHWDPLLSNALAQQREIILLDNSGIGKSTGTVPENFTGWAANVIALVRALGIEKIDLLGFSMGGMCAQLVALNAPGLVRKLIIAGSGPSKADGIEGGDPEAFTVVATAATAEEKEDAFLKTFFSASEEKQARGREWWRRVHERSLATSGEERSDYLGPEGTGRQIKAVMKFAGGESDGAFERLGELDIPVFVVNGNKDVLVPTVNSWVMSQRVRDAQLLIFPDSGHGAIFEHAEVFAKYVDLFLGQ
jgi:pimeloyl-ACP methyl ester carboxylesterase